MEEQRWSVRDVQSDEEVYREADDCDLGGLETGTMAEQIEFASQEDFGVDGFETLAWGIDEWLGPRGR